VEKKKKVGLRNKEESDCSHTGERSGGGGGPGMGIGQEEKEPHPRGGGRSILKSRCKRRTGRAGQEEWGRGCYLGRRTT